MSTVEITLPKPHEKQQEILDNAARFNIVKTGRRFGKTELLKELTLPALEGNKIGVWFPTYKDLSKVWIKIKTLYSSVITAKDESLKQLYLINGGEIDFWSMENPSSGRGWDYDRVIIDEFAKAPKAEEAWNETIRPTLTDRKGDGFFFSTPKGKHNYFYQLEEATRDYDNWKVFHYTSYDNPHIPNSEIEEARQQLDDLTFRQEYLAEDVDKNEKPYLYCYDSNKHYGYELQIDPKLPIWFSFDFNIDPMTCTVAQRKDILRIDVFEAIQLNSSDIYEMTDYLRAKYAKYLRDCKTTGDASGKNRSAAVRGKTNYWKIIANQLQLRNDQVKLRKKNLIHDKSRPLVNSVLQNADIRIDKNCKNLDRDLKYAAVDEFGDVVKSSMEGRHHFDNFRYLIDANYPDFLNNFDKYKRVNHD